MLLVVRKLVNDLRHQRSREQQDDGHRPEVEGDEREGEDGGRDAQPEIDAE